jgi:hypothetical protein
VIPSTGYYYFFFVNPNPGPISLKFEAEYLKLPAYQWYTTSNSAEMTTTVIQEPVGEAPMDYGIAFYSGLVVAVIGIAMVFIDFRKSARRR